MDMKACLSASAILMFPLVCAASGTGGSGVRLEAEGGGVWIGRNDVEVPGDTGTRFDLLDLVGSGPEGYYRIHADWQLNRWHSLRATLAPLELSGSGTLERETEFAGTTFQAGKARASYEFSTYRITYRYTLFSGPADLWRIGLTGLVRDAEIELQQNGRRASDSNVGFVPLLHLDGRHRLGGAWRFVWDFDGAAAPQGRALDLALKVERGIGERWQAGVGYRTLEGGVDNDEVYNFAWLQYGFASLAYRF